MAITYNWIISTVDAHTNKDGKSNVIFNVHYSLIAYDDENNIRKFYTNCTTIGEPNDNFIEYDDLQKSDVEGWLESTLDVEAIKESLNAQIQEAINPPVVHLKPNWNNQSNE